MNNRFVVLALVLVTAASRGASAELADDARYCAALANAYVKYGHIFVEAVPVSSTLEVNLALESCDTDPSTSIPVLEAALASVEVALPKRDGAPKTAAAPPPVVAPAASPLKPEDRNAAHRGDAIAQYDLGRRYEAGNGVLQDYVLAHMWLNLSAVSQSPIRGMAAQAREQLQQKMTPIQVADAQRLARDWKPTR